MSPDNDRPACTPSTEANPGPAVLKIVVAGGFGAGKTTLVGAVSEIPPLSTEEYLTTAGTGTDRLAGVEAKDTTTVSLDFGRLTFTQPHPMQLFLFGTPGQQRFWFFWDELCHGAVGAVVLADTRRLADSFAPISYFEQRGLPFVVAVNHFQGTPHRYTSDEVGHALELPRGVPVVDCDAREPRSAAIALITLVEHVLFRPHTHPSIHRGAHS